MNMQQSRRRPISELTTDELRARAAEVRAMAATATTKNIQDSLYRLTERFDRRAHDRTEDYICLWTNDWLRNSLISGNHE